MSYFNYIKSLFWNKSNNDDLNKKKSNSTLSTKKVIRKLRQFKVIDKYIDKYYYLALFKDESKMGWSIHGLWPQKYNGKILFCKNETFSIDKLNPIRKDLDLFWYSRFEKNDAFWKHEYLKHGTCNFNGFDEFNYFKTTLDLYMKALEKDLPEYYYDENTQKCMIPVDTDLKFCTIK